MNEFTVEMQTHTLGKEDHRRGRAASSHLADTQTNHHLGVNTSITAATRQLVVGGREREGNSGSQSMDDGPDLEFPPCFHTQNNKSRKAKLFRSC